MALIKYSSLPTFILAFLHLPASEYYEYIIAGSLALMARLGIKGVVIEIAKETYLNMDGVSGPSGTSGPSGLTENELIERSKAQSVECLARRKGIIFLPEDIVNDLNNMIKKLETITKLNSEEALRLSSL